MSPTAAKIGAETNRMLRGSAWSKPPQQRQECNMKRQTRNFISLVMCSLTLASGCKPTQPFFFAEDGNILGKGDLSHYLNVATEIEYPDVDSMPLDEVTGAAAPLTIANSENFDVWDITLEEVTRITLTNSKVIRQLGGRISDGGSNIAVATPETLQQGAANAITTYDPALVESGNGTGTGSPYSGTGVESALSEFDATLDYTATWSKNDRPQNFGGIAGNLFAPVLLQDQGNYSVGVNKTAATGTQFGIRNNTIYDFNNNGSRISPDDWFTNIEASFSQPLLQGAGVQYNRIAGPQSFQQANGGVPNQIDGVIIARIRYDIALTDFEEGVRNLMRDVEDAYWELYFAYRDLDARKIGRDSALETWRKVKALKGVGTQGGEADKEAQARSQYFLFRSQVEAALTNLFRIENRLRYMMGLAATDNRLLRPIDEPTTAKIDFEWPSIHLEALTRRTEIRSQKWMIKRRELELIATKNNLLPRLDAGGTYRWLGGGEDLINDGAPTGAPPNVNHFAPGTSAWESLTSGDFQEWQLAVQFSMPIGFRNALAGVRHHQLLLARERAVLEDLELEISHQLTDAVRDIDFNFQNTQTNFNRRVASQDEVDAVRTVYESGRVPIDLLLDAQRRRAEAESAYYRSLVDYNRAIMRVHYRKGSLLEYNGVYLAEGPWPGKAYFDAMRRARHRDASTFIDYGYSRPGVISRGPVGQFLSPAAGNAEVLQSPTPVEAGSPPANENGSEALPIPDPAAITPTPADPTSAAIQGNVQAIDLVNLPAAENGVSFGFAELPPVGSEIYPAIQADLTSSPISQVDAVNHVGAVSQVGFVEPIAPAAPITTPQASLTIQPTGVNMPAEVPATPPNQLENPFRNPNRPDAVPRFDANTRSLPMGMSAGVTPTP
jgi:outer membrane protein TolC